MTDRARLLSILVRSPPGGYRMAEVYALMYPESGIRGWSRLRRALDGLDYPIFADEGMVGILQPKKTVYMPLPIETICKSLK
jgi:hypothetical protein